MISGILQTLFGTFAILISALFLYEGAQEPSWLMIAMAALFLWFGQALVREGIRWAKMLHHSRLQILPEGVIIGAQRYPFRDILHITCTSVRTEKRMNFVRSGVDHTVIASLETPDSVLELRAGQGPSTWMSGSFGQADADKLLRKIDSLDQASFHYRLERVVHQLEREGYWIYNGCKIDRQGNIAIGGKLVRLSKLTWRRSDPYQLKFSGRSLSISRDRALFLHVAKEYFKTTWVGLSAIAGKSEPQLGEWLVHWGEQSRKLCAVMEHGVRCSCFDHSEVSIFCAATLQYVHINHSRFGVEEQLLSSFRRAVIEEIGQDDASGRDGPTRLSNRSREYAGLLQPCFAGNSDDQKRRALVSLMQSLLTNAVGVEKAEPYRDNALSRASVIAALLDETWKFVRKPHFTGRSGP